MATQQVVNVGAQANDATGDLLRDAFIKINTNFAAFFTGNFPTGQTGSFTATGVGFSGAAPTMLCNWRTITSIAVLQFASTGILAPSNSTSFSLTGLPAAITPTFLVQAFQVGAIDNGVEVSDAALQIGSNGILTLTRLGVNTGWTATGNKGFGATTVTYLLS